MTRQRLMDIQRTTIKGVTLPIMWGLLASTVVMTASVAGTYYALKADIQEIKSNAKLRQVEVDGKFEKIELANQNYWNNVNDKFALYQLKK